MAEETGQAADYRPPLLDGRGGQSRRTGVAFEEVAECDHPRLSLLLKVSRVSLPVQPLPLDYPFIERRPVLVIVTI